MVTRYGMSSLGPIVYDETREHPYLGRDMQKTRFHSEKTAEKVDFEVEKVIIECLQDAQQLMTQNKSKLEKLAQKLLEKETLQAEEVYELLEMEPRETHNWNN
jgi:cell division protease FtsH